MQVSEANFIFRKDPRFRTLVEEEKAPLFWTLVNLKVGGISMKKNAEGQA